MITSMIKPPDSISISDDSDTPPHPKSNTNSTLKHFIDIKSNPKV